MPILNVGTDLLMMRSNVILVTIHHLIIYFFQFIIERGEKPNEYELN